MKAKSLLVLGLTAPFFMLGCKQSSSKMSLKPRAVGTAKLTGKPSETPSSNPLTPKISPSADPESTKPETGTPNSLAQNCFYEICGSEHMLDIPALMKKAEQGSSEQVQYFEKNLNENISEALREKLEAEKILAEKRIESRKNLNSIELTTFQLDLIKSVAVVLGNDKLVPQEVLIRSAVIFSSNKTLKLFNKYKNKNLENFFKEEFNEIDSNKALAMAAKWIKEKSSEINERANGDMIHIGSSAIENIESGQALNSEEMNSLAGEVMLLRLIEDLQNPKNAETMAKIDLNKENIAKFLKEKEIRPVDGESLDKAIQQCKTSYFASYNLSPTKEELEKVKTVINEVKKLAIASLPQITSEQKSKIEDINFVLPKSNVDIHNVFTNNIKLNKKRNLEFKQSLDKMNLTTALTYDLIYSIIETKDSSLCKNFVDLNISDRAYLNSNDIVLSWYSAKYLDKGVNIIAHEIGHIVETMGLVEPSVKSCLIKKQSQDTRFFSEDFADRFSAKIMNELEKQGQIKPKNAGCDFRSLENKELALNQIDNKDPHSSAFYRALNIHIESGKKLGEACVQALKQRTDLQNSCQ